MGSVGTLLWFVVCMWDAGEGERQCCDSKSLWKFL